MKEESFLQPSILIASLSLLVSIVAISMPVAGDLFPSSKTNAAISSSHWTIGEGRLGKGPQLTAKISFSNAGNRTVTVTEMHVKFALGSADAKVESCYSGNFTWMGAPWDRLHREPSAAEAISIQVVSGIPVTEVVLFEPANVLSDEDRKKGDKHQIFACLEFTTVDPNLESQTARMPIGSIEFSDARILDVKASSQTNKGFTIRR